MAGDKYDIVVYGATGFTGQKVVQEIVNSKFAGSFAMAGRNRERLEVVAAQSGCPNAPIIIADAKDAESLFQMASKARVVISTVGPFRFYGLPVVEACIKAKADYLDVSGEPEFIERVEYEFSLKTKAAQSAGVYVASAVGFDSVPGDCGALWTAQQFTPPSRCTNIETFITIRGGPSGFRGHYPTYASAVHGFAAAGELSALRKQATEARGGRINLNVPGPRPKIDTKPQPEPRIGPSIWRFPFMGSDASVVRRTAAALTTIGNPAYNCAVYLTLPSRYYAYLFILFGGVFSFLAKRSWGRSILLKFPRLFSFGMFTHEGPSAEQMEETSFEMINFATGYSQVGPQTPGELPDKKIVTRVAGPEPGYKACSIFVVAAAATLVQDREKLGIEPGVHTPAFLFQNTSYIDRLKTRGIKFEVVDEEPTASQ